MNKEHIQEIRDFIAKLPETACDMTLWQDIAWVGDDDRHQVTFNEMQEKRFSCGTAGCIGGWTELYVNHIPYNDRHLHDDNYIYAADYFELTSAESQALFMLYPGNPPDGITWKEWILARLGGVLEEGVIRGWKEQLPERLTAD